MKKALATITPAIGYLTLAATALAQQLGTNAPTGGVKDFPAFIGNTVTVVLIIAGILIFVFLVWAGLQWMMSGGDKGKVEEARNRITAALIGLAIVAVAYALAQLIANYFGAGGGLGSALDLPTDHL